MVERAIGLVGLTLDLVGRGWELPKKKLRALPSSTVSVSPFSKGLKRDVTYLFRFPHSRARRLPVV